MAPALAVLCIDRVTQALVVDEEGGILGRGVGGPANFETAGAEVAAASLADAAGAALRDADLHAGDLAAATFALAGVDWPSDVDRVRATISPFLSIKDITVVNDAFAVLRAGTSEAWGIAVIAGYGTVAVGRDPAGDSFRTIGEGPTFGDFGDELDVSQLAVRAVADAYTGRGPATMLSEMLCDRLGQPTVEALLEHLARNDPTLHAPELHNLAPMVLAATEAGDLVARSVLERIGHELGEAASLVARRLNLTNLDVEVVLAGGLFGTPNRYLMDVLELGVRRTVSRAKLQILVERPVVGAALLALERGGLRTSGAAAARLRQEAAHRPD